MSSNQSNQAMDISDKNNVFTLADYNPVFKNSTLGQMDIRRVKSFIILCIQTGFFFVLFLIGFIYALLFVEDGRFRYACYSLTHTRLAELKIPSADNFSDLTDLPCSLQMHSNDYFLSVKFVLLYYLLIVIGMIYTWHRTVRFSYCVITFLVIADIIFRTDLVHYFDHIVYITSVICMKLLLMFSGLEILMPHNVRDPLRTFCERITLPNDPNGFFYDGHSQPTRFYQQVKKIKKQWNIKEEKLIITAIVGVIPSIILIIWFGYMAS